MEVEFEILVELVILVMIFIEIFFLSRSFAQHIKLERKIDEHIKQLDAHMEQLDKSMTVLRDMMAKYDP